MNELNFFDLDTATVTGEVEHGSGRLLFPIRIERAATESEVLKELAGREQEIRERYAAEMSEAQANLARAESVVTPDTPLLFQFFERLTNSLGAVVFALEGTEEQREREGKKFKPDVARATKEVGGLLASLETLSEPLLVTDEAAKEAREKALEQLAQVRTQNTAHLRDLHRLSAERIAFWCPDWTGEKDGQQVPITADVLEKRSPELLSKIEEEIEKKAPNRSIR